MDGDPQQSFATRPSNATGSNKSRLRQPFVLAACPTSLLHMDGIARGSERQGCPAALRLYDARIAPSFVDVLGSDTVCVFCAYSAALAGCVRAGGRVHLEHLLELLWAERKEHNVKIVSPVVRGSCVVHHLRYTQLSRLDVVCASS